MEKALNIIECINLMDERKLSINEKLKRVIRNNEGVISTIYEYKEEKDLLTYLIGYREAL